MCSIGSEQHRPTPTEALSDHPDRPIFQHIREPVLGPDERITKKPTEGRRQARQQRRFNFRDSMGCFETSRLVVPQPCSSPSCRQNPAKRPSGQAQPGSRLDPTPAAGLSHHSRAAKLVALKTQINVSSISPTYWTACLARNTLRACIAKPSTSSSAAIPSPTPNCHRSAAHIWTGWRGVVLPGNVPIGALTLLGEAAHFSLRGPIIKLKRRSPAGASWTPACFP